MGYFFDSPKEDKPLGEDYTRCDKCGDVILKGDVRHMHTGDDVCEYCSDSYDPEDKDY